MYFLILQLFFEREVCIALRFITADTELPRQWGEPCTTHIVSLLGVTGQGSQKTVAFSFVAPNPAQRDTA